jgi:exopolysaccharide production protein ExoY
MEDVPVIDIHSPSLSLEQVLKAQVRRIPIKRIFDILFSLCFFSLGLPLLLLIACAIKLTSKGKIVYSHERIGRGGVRFRCYKFRTMRKDADAYLNTLLKAHPDLKNEWEASRKLKKDPRITYIGAFLRKTSLDELPQFWNVLKGDLSIVGPRPVVQAELDKYYGCKKEKILSVRPGLTGIWQVSGRNDVSYMKRVFLDEKYIDSQSFWLDLKLILKTIPAMVKSSGAY